MTERAARHGRHRPLRLLSRTKGEPVEVRRKVSDLKVGDEVKNYGVLVEIDIGCQSRLVSKCPIKRPADIDIWPLDAEVTVLVPDVEYRLTVTYTSRDRRALENSWPTNTVNCDGWVNEKVKRTVGVIEEVSA